MVANIRSGKCHFLKRGHWPIELLFKWYGTYYIWKKPPFEETSVTKALPSFYGYYMYGTYYDQKMQLFEERTFD